MSSQAPGATALRAVAFVPYPLRSAPSQRFRLEQWDERLRSRGIGLEFRPFATAALVSQLYRPGQSLGKAAGLAKALLAQYRQIPARGSFDVAIVHRGMSLVGPAFLERRLARIGPIIYDFDDAIHVLNSSDANRAFGWLKFPGKTAEICRLARAVTVGNQYLAEFAGRYNRDVTIVPSSVDTTIYTSGAPRAPRAKPVVGWMGSSTSQALMEPFAPLLARIPAAGLTLRLVSDRRPVNFPFPFEWKAWSAETEVDDLRDFDLGIMPLPDTEWAKGKCAMKILQYMGVGVPSIGSALGGNLEVIRDGENGLLATTGDDWMEKITRIARDLELARRLGAAGRETVVARYSSDVCADRFAEVVLRVVRS
jgi:glycosyltransferase involved in cell wall biosynthesis